MLVIAIASTGAPPRDGEIAPAVRVHRIDPVGAASGGAQRSSSPRPVAWGIAAEPQGATAPVKLEDLTRLTVRGHAQLDKPADRLRLDVGVVTQQATPTGALQENSRLMDEVVKALRKVGLEASELQTGHFDLQPVYSQRPPIRTQQDIDEWEPKIIAYRAANTVHVKTKKLDLAGAIIQAANEAGANRIGSIGFDLADPRVHRTEAIRTATSNALTDAGTLAEAAGVELVRIVSIDLDPFGYQPVVDSMPMMRSAMAEGAAPPVMPGDVMVTAGVTVVYEIRQK
jgi:uncharacterized protein YggE